MTFGQLIKSHREARGWSRWRLKETTGVALTKIRKIEEGVGTCTLETAHALLAGMEIETIDVANLQVRVLAR